MPDGIEHCMAAELGALLPTILDLAVKGEL
jgi:hypothetical protein